LVGEAAVFLGAGRTRKGDPIDHAVGLVVHRKIGDWVEAGQPLLSIHANEEKKLAEAREHLRLAFSWNDDPVPALPLFYE
jgi:pyrimidine-nucleoside phosphorylase